MIKQNIYLKDWNWVGSIYYIDSSYCAEDILEELELIGCDKKDLIKVNDLLDSHNTGFTYSNFLDKCSVMVIGLTTTPAEFQNTFDHEKVHLAIHIAQALNINVFSEEFGYLIGDIGQQMFPVAKKFLCEHCRKDGI